MRASIFGNLRAGTTSAAGSPSQTPLSAPKADSSAVYNDVEPLSLPPPAAATNTNNAVLSPPPITAPRSRPLTRLTPFGRKSSPAREVPTPTASPAPTPSITASPSLAATTGVSYLDSLGLRLGEAVNKALILPPAPHPTGGATGITKVAANAAAGSGAKVGGVGVSEGPDAVLKGKRPLPLGRGRALGALITRSISSFLR